MRQLRSLEPREQSPKQPCISSCAGAGYRGVRTSLAGAPLLVLAGLLLSVGGCAGQGSADPATQPSLAAANAPGAPAASTGSPSGLVVGGAGPTHHSERERRLAELSTSKIAFLRVSWAKVNYFVSDTYDNWFGTPPSTYQKMMESPAADARRVGINGLAKRDFGELPPYTTRYAQIANSDTDYLVRATAIRSLNRARDRSAIPLFVKALEDPHVPVRLEACKALNHMPDPSAIAPLLRILNPPDEVSSARVASFTRPAEDKDVRIAAVDALGHYRTYQVANTLVNLLSDRDFGVAWSAHRSLVAITGKDFRYDAAAWGAYLSGPEKPFG